jgi:rare lipoprotein A
MRPVRLVLMTTGWIAGLVWMGCGTSSPRFTARETAGVLSPPVLYQLSGIASYYADEFNGRRTASGETFDMREMTAAHRTLPFNSIVMVHNLYTGKSFTFSTNDRGPFKDNRVIDLSLAAARKLDLVRNGTAPVKLEIVQLGSVTN